MKISNFKFRRCLRSAGGINIGLKVNLPISLLSNDYSTVNDNVSVLLGLFAWEMYFSIDYNFRAPQF